MDLRRNAFSSLIPEHDMKTSTAQFPQLVSIKALDQQRNQFHFIRSSLRTNQAFVYWFRAFIHFHGVRHPASMGGSEVEAFCLVWLTRARCRHLRTVRYWRPLAKGRATSDFKVEKNMNEIMGL